MTVVPFAPFASLTPLGLGTFAGFAASTTIQLSPRPRPDGVAPVDVVAAVLRGTSLSEVRSRDSVFAHLGIGALAGLIYAFAFLTLAQTPLLTFDSVTFGGATVLAHVVALIAAVSIVYFCFADVVLPYASDLIYEEQATAIRGRWLRYSLTLGATLALIGPLSLSTLI